MAVWYYKVGENMNKICVYTCITGNYDNLIEINNIEEGIDYICYTNNKEIKSKTWKVEYIQDDNLTNVQLARKIKILGTPKLAKYDVVVWIDGRIYFEKSIKDFIKEYVDLKNYDLVGFKHFCRNSINNEMIANYEIEKIDITGLNKLDKFYKKEKFPDNCGLIETTLLFRNFNNTKLNKAMQDWFNMILEYSYRDQLSFNYVEWKNKLKVKYLDINIWDNEYFKFNLHRSEPIKVSYIPGYSQTYDMSNICTHNILSNGSIKITYTFNSNADILRLLFNTRKKLVLVNLEIYVNKSKINSFIIENSKKINSKIYFINLPIININHSFKKGDKVLIKCYLEGLNKYEANDKLYSVESESIISKGKLYKKISENETIIAKKESKIFKQKAEITILKKQNAELKKELEEVQFKYSEIINSKRWQKINSILKIIGK